MAHRLAGLLAGAFLVAAALPLRAEVAPLERWRQMRSANFLLVGDVGERELRSVAGRLEQFRAAVGAILPRATVTTATPTTVIVFRSHRSFRPFKPLYNGEVSEHIGGYFLAGSGVNHITLTVESRGLPGENRFGVIYHELVHLMVSNTLRGVPLWLNEGLAEYYRTLEVERGGTRVKVGNPHAPHVLRLRERLLPLDQLVAVGHGSPLYNERDRASIFYAQSWALVHYLVLGDKRKHAAAMSPLVEALAEGVGLEQASQRALGMSADQLQKALRTYISRDSFPILQYTLAEPLAAVEKLTAAPLPDADAHATVGSLLVRMDRAAEGRPHLERAVALDPANAPAHAALGALHARQGDRDMARRHLQQAAAAPGSSAQAHYDLADALIEVTQGAGAPDPVDQAAIEHALRQAIALNPSFAEAHARLARHLEPARTDEVLSLQQRAIALSPGREDYVLALAYYLSNRQRYADARILLSKLAASAADESIRSNAGMLLKRIDDFEHNRPSDQIVEHGPAGPRVIRLDLRPVRDGERQVTGLLLAIECPRAGINLVVEHEGRTSRVAVPAFDAVEFITYRPDQAGSISCGERPDGDDVIVTYRPGAAGQALGEAVAVEFLPKASAP